MGNFIKFEKKFGYPELIALIAIIVSVISYRQSNKASLPSIEVNEDLAGAGVYDSDDEGKKYFSYTRIMIANQGGKAVSLIGVKAPEESLFPNMFLGRVRADSTEEIPVEIFLVDEYLEVIKEDTSLVSSFESMGREELSLLNRTVSPGKPIILNIGTRFNISAADTLEIREVFAQYELVFSNGHSRMVQKIFEL